MCNMDICLPHCCFYSSLEKTGIFFSSFLGCPISLARLTDKSVKVRLYCVKGLGDGWTAGQRSGQLEST